MTCVYSCILFKSLHIIKKFQWCLSFKNKHKHISNDFVRSGVPVTFGAKLVISGGNIVSYIFCWISLICFSVNWNSWKLVVVICDIFFVDVDVDVFGGFRIDNESILNVFRFCWFGWWSWDGFVGFVRLNLVSWHIIFWKLTFIRVNFFENIHLMLFELVYLVFWTSTESLIEILHHVIRFGEVAFANQIHLVCWKLGLWMKSFDLFQMFL